MKSFLTLKNFFLFCCLLIVLMGIGGFVLVNYMLPYSPIKPYRVKVENLSEFSTGALPSDYGMNYDPFVLSTFDSLKLSCYYIKAEQPRGTVILLHGIGDCKEHFYRFCNKLASIHFNSVLIDSRAHGKSEGQYCTFGYKERRDVDSLIRYINREYQDSIIGIYGSSLGGAIALQVLGTHPELKFGIVESTYHNFEAVLNEYFEDIVCFKSPKIVHHVIQKSAGIADFDYQKVNPLDFCDKIHCPMFVGHGDMDSKIPLEFNRNNYNQLPSNQKQFVMVKGAGHLNVHQVGGEHYWHQLKEFLTTLKFED